MMQQDRISLFAGILLGLAGMLLSACGGSEPLQSPPPVAEADTTSTGDPVVKGIEKSDYVEVEVFYGTDRARTGSKEPVEFYGGGRGTFEVGTVKVSIPKGHQVGQLESPVWWKLEITKDPAKHVVLLEVTPMAEDRMYGRLGAAVARSGERALLVFVHGYNVTFEDAARRTAQIAYDLPYDGVPVLYSWPANGALLDYTADEADVRWTVPHLEGFLLDLVDRSGADKIHLIAHSMGNRAVTSALLEISEQVQEPIFNEIVLTAPDIDADVFARDIAPAIVPLGDRVTLYASSRDRALTASRGLHGYPRAGESGENIVVVDGIETIDASQIDTDMLGHSYFAQTRLVLQDLYSLLQFGTSPDQRRLQKGTKSGRAFWILQ